MKTSIYKIHSPFEDYEGYITVDMIKQYTGKGSTIPGEVEIPEWFQPTESPEGRCIVVINGSGYMLDEVLGIGAHGEPVIQWTDEKLGCKRTVSLQFEPFYSWSSIW